MLGKRIEKLVGRHIDPEIDDLVPAPRNDHRNDVLPDVVQIPGDRSDHKDPFPLDLARLQERLEVLQHGIHRHTGYHQARDKCLLLAELFTDPVHPDHASLKEFVRLCSLLQGLGGNFVCAILVFHLRRIPCRPVDFPFRDTGGDSLDVILHDPSPKLSTDQIP
jgi:hypothetical protein